MELRQNEVDRIAQELIARGETERYSHLALTRYTSSDRRKWLDVFDYGQVELAYKQSPEFTGVVDRYFLSNEIDQIAMHDASIRRSTGGYSF